MLRLILITVLLAGLGKKTAAQQNWAAIPCSKMSLIAAVNSMFVDSLHNQIILNSMYGHQICNVNYKGFFAYDGSGFRNLDLGVNTHISNSTLNNVPMNGCITYENKTLFGGVFLTIGSNTLHSKSVALWNGTVWDTFPKHVFNNDLNYYNGGGFYGFLKHNGKLLMYGGFDTIGGIISKDIVAFDGNTFTAIPPIPVNNRAPITKMIVYKNKLIANGNFYDFPSFDFFRLAQFDGTNWSQVGNGLQGNVTGAWDMQVYNDTLYIAGNFPKSAGNAGNYIMKWDGNQLYDAGFGGWCGYGPILRLVQYKNRLYAFGGFSCAANQKAFGVAYYENGIWTVPKDSIDDAITGAVVYNDAIYIGGGFKSVNGDTSIQKFAKLICPDFDAFSGCISGYLEQSIHEKTKLFPNPTNSILTVNTSILGNKQVTIQDATGRQILSKTLSELEFRLDLSDYSQGIYFLFMQTEIGLIVRKILIE